MTMLVSRQGINWPNLFLLLLSIAAIALTVVYFAGKDKTQPPE